MMHPLRQLVSEAKSAIYRRPNDELRRMRRWGLRAYVRCDAWAREMEQAAWTLPRVDNGNAANTNEQNSRPLEVWFLTGRRFWYQTAFCAFTLARQSGRELVLNLADDGSLEPRHEEALRRLFPRGVTLKKESVHGRLDDLMPIQHFPVLRQRWADYINIRKLIDIHLGSTGVKLVLDSDMLFFKRPDALLAWWDEANRRSGEMNVRGGDDEDIVIQTASVNLQLSPFSPCLMTDCEESYGYSRGLMEDLTRAPIPPSLNVGICGLRSEDLDWEELEFWCGSLVGREGTTYYLEQALVAMIAASKTPTIMSREDYITFPTNDQVIGRCGVLQHYVADSKPWYFGTAWKLAMKSE